MPAILELSNFYKHIDSPTLPTNSEIGHFNIFRIEDIFIPHKRKATYTRRSFYKVSLITGHNKLHYAGKCTEINGTALVFTNPNIPYFWETISDRQSGYMCIFTEPFFNRFANIKDYPVFQFVDGAVLALAEPQAQAATTLFSRMHNELQADYIYKYDLLRTLLLELVHEAQKIHPTAAVLPTGANAAERIAAMFVELLERQFPIELTYQVMQLTTPSAFAKQLNVHVNHLKKALKEITGHTTSQLISDRILQEAKVLLTTTNWTIAEIACSLGFEEPNHFSSFFQNQDKTYSQQIPVGPK